LSQVTPVKTVPGGQEETGREGSADDDEEEEDFDLTATTAERRREVCRCLQCEACLNMHDDGLRKAFMTSNLERKWQKD